MVFDSVPNVSHIEAGIGRKPFNSLLIQVFIGFSGTFEVSWSRSVELLQIFNELVK